MRLEDPSQILALLNTALLTQREDRRFATVLFGRFASNGHEGAVSFEFSSGGHPLPLVLSANNGGGGREVGAPGTLLGIVGDPALRDHQVTLSAGDALVLYTDGVTDAAAPERVWTPPELAAAVGPTAGLDADAIAERKLRAALDSTEGEPRDDIAIIVLKVPERAVA
jgi:sigma-B regulation protein RsbU (phosphoserine phosphatase)